MENINVGDVCKVTATAFAGMFAGGALGMNTTAMPALMKIQDPASFRVGWKYLFLTGAKYQPRLALVSMVAGSAAYYHDNTATKNLWLAGVGSMVLIFPWTKFVMLPDIKRLLKDNVIEERGEEWVRSNIETWGRRHFFRSVVSTISFGIFLYALSNK